MIGKEAPVGRGVMVSHHRWKEKSGPQKVL